MKQTLFAFCIEQDKTDLLNQWDNEKNGELTPEKVSAGSHKKVWWKCEKGHHWSAQIKARVQQESGCPVCANRLLLPGVNDLASCFPELASQWHPTLNEDLTPRDILLGTRKNVWWQCDKGHSWKSSVYIRAQKEAGCPVCSGKIVIPGENDLATAFPEIAAQWHKTKNHPLSADQVSPYSNRKAWWTCDLGHEYEAMIPSRTSGQSGCPYCAGRKVLPGFNDLATVEPKVAAQWHPSLNAPLEPSMVTAGCKKKIWWMCREGHVWKTVVYARTGNQRTGCPVCAGKVKTRTQKL